MALERCPECNEPAQSIRPADPVPLVIPETFECLCRNGHVWTEPNDRAHSNPPESGSTLQRYDGPDDEWGAADGDYTEDRG